MTQHWTHEYTDNLFYRIDENTRMIHKALSHISDEELWKRPNVQSNSIGNLLLHLCGNIHQYAISALGNKNDERNRDVEFDTNDGYTKLELMNKLEETLEKAKDTMNALSEADWLKHRSVQGFRFSGIGIALHVVEHYSYHTGQIAWWVKQMKNVDLGFYDGIDLNQKNN